ncbi:MAG: cyclomaltodextrinase [Candidatus Cloacimonetes bacterium]|nr:cyclomaltodextrinase [Candidatus Cloacimonadota bacterium]
MPEIEFRYQPPTAGDHQVGIAGDFTDWEILDMTDIGGIYLFRQNIRPGAYRYKLIVDGNWMPDPNCPEREPDPFGGQNSLLKVKGHKEPELTWSDIEKNLGLLFGHDEPRLQINRLSQNRFELRFHWHKTLPANLYAFVDDKRFDLFYLGEAQRTAVWHCFFGSNEATAEILIRIEGRENTLCYGAEAFTSPCEARPLQVDLKELERFTVPEWASEAIVYQIFPDRFYNGNPANDPDFSEDYYADCRTPPPEGEFLPPNREYFHLVEDWNDISGLKQSPWLPKGKPDWWSFYGGDIAGVRHKLPYLADLGITVIYFNPLWQARSNHKYDAIDFCAIDPHFGSKEEMTALVSEAHALGIKIIVDVAFNHTGEDFWAFQDCAEKGPDSRYWNWYDWHRWPLPEPLPADFQPKDYYQSWWGIKDMPDLNFDLSRTHPAENHIKDIKHAEPNWPLVEHLLHCTRWWLLEIGIDGFRLDVPDEVPFWFWELFRREVKSLKPEAWIVGEIWQNARPWVNPKYFDSVMNYAYFKDPVLDFFILGICGYESFVQRVEEGLAQYPWLASQAMMNLLGSHDTVRVLELAGGDLHKVKLAMLFLMTFVGAPHIYYGDEIAMPGGRDPDNRRPFNWDWENNSESIELREFAKKLVKLRKEYKVLTQGHFAFWDPIGDDLTWVRFDHREAIFVKFNLMEIPLEFNFNYNDEILLSLGYFNCADEQLVLAPGSAIMWHKKRSKRFNPRVHKVGPWWQQF